MFGSKDSPLVAAFPQQSRSGSSGMQGGQKNLRGYITRWAKQANAWAVNDIVKPDEPLGYRARLKCRFPGVLVPVWGGAVISIKKENQ
jgi:hypothetical protein